MIIRDMLSYTSLEIIVNNNNIFLREEVFKVSVKKKF